MNSGITGRANMLDVKSSSQCAGTTETITEPSRAVSSPFIGTVVPALETQAARAFAFLDGVFGRW